MVGIDTSFLANTEEPVHSPYDLGVILKEEDNVIPMTLQEIKQAVDEGKTVCWSHHGYTVIKDRLGEYLIKDGDFYVALHGKAGTKYEDQPNGDLSKFFILN